MEREGRGPGNVLPPLFCLLTLNVMELPAQHHHPYPDHWSVTQPLQLENLEDVLQNDPQGLEN